MKLLSFIYYTSTAMPPKKAAGGRGPKASKLCIQVPPKTETPGKDPIQLLKEIGHGGFARIYKAEIKVCLTNVNLIYNLILVYTYSLCRKSRTFREWLFVRRNEIVSKYFDRKSTELLQNKET